MSTPTLPPTTTPAETVIPVIGEYIVKTPGTCSGEPRILGTRIKVKHIFRWVEQGGMKPAEVVVTYPHLTMAAVHAALAYYWSHQEEIHRDIEAEEKLVAEMRAKAGPSLLQKSLAERRGQNDSLPPG